MRTKLKPDLYCLWAISRAIIDGYSYEEGIAIFETIVFLMKEINKDPSINTDYLAIQADAKLKEYPCFK